jgi:hypothetical protein
MEFVAFLRGGRRESQDDIRVREARRTEKDRSPSSSATWGEGLVAIVSPARQATF